MPVPDECFILGAGFSKEIYDGMPDMSMLSNQVWENVRDLLPKEDYPDSFKDDLEALLTYASKDKPWLKSHENHQYRAIFEKTKEHLSFVIKRQEVEAVNNTDKEDLAWLETLINYWEQESDKKHILTFNYDTLLERFYSSTQNSLLRANDWQSLYDIPAKVPEIELEIQRMADPMRELGRFQLTLLKLHGSTNWYYSGSENYIGEEVVILPTKRWPEEESLEIGSLLSRKKRFAKGLSNLILPPVYDKDNFLVKRVLKHLWFSALEFVRFSRKIYLLGYSFPKSDNFLRYFFLESLTYPQQDIDNRIPDRKQLIPVNTSEDVVFNLREHFDDEERIEINEDYIGIDDPIPSLASDLDQD